MGLNAPPNPTLWVGKAHRVRIQEVLKNKHLPILAVAPIANWEGKEWPLERYQQLLELLMSQGGPLEKGSVAIITAPHERAKALPLLNHLGERAIDGTIFEDLLDGAALLQHCQWFIGNDSGLMHMAAALKVRTLGLFGPSKDYYYSPWGGYSIRTPESFEDLTRGIDFSAQACFMISLTVNAVYKAAQQMFTKTFKNP